MQVFFNRLKTFNRRNRLKKQFLFQHEIKTNLKTIKFIYFYFRVVQYLLRNIFIKKNEKCLFNFDFNCV